MERFSATEPAPAALRGAAVALGNLDGVHKGHQAVLDQARKVASARGALLGAAVFEPHPRQIFTPNSPPFRLQSPGQRARALEALGVDVTFEIPFNQGFSGLSDVDFAKVILAERLGVSHVVVGFDFKFGRGRTGDVGKLTQLGSELGFSVAVVDPVENNAHLKISSSAIRDALVEGRVEDAAALLTRPFAIEGVVLPGMARGRTIGFPTANVALGAYLRPRFGVYAVRVRLDDGRLIPGVANLGVKPTVSGANEPLLEVHLFDFAEDLYGHRIEADFIKFLRPERKFESFDALKSQIAKDAEQARAVLG